MVKSRPESANLSSKPRRFVRRLIKASAGLAALIVTGFSALLALLWLEHRTEITLPVPTGHFAVGRATATWVNDAQIDDLAPSPGVKRRVMVWIWYPAVSSGSDRPSDYMPAPWRAAEARSSGVLMSQFLTRDASKVHTHSLSNPGVSLEQRTYPVVVVRAGGGALTTAFTTLAEDLASHGYIVVGFDAPYRTGVVVFPDGRVVMRPPTADPENLGAVDQSRLINKLLPMWSSDAQLVVDQLDHLNSADPTGRFTGRLDMRRIGIFGHSFGGATALQFCHDDSRCKAGIDIDGALYGPVVKDGVTQPFLFLLSDHGGLTAPDTRAVFADIESVYDRLCNGRLLLIIRGANHFSFSDQILLKSQYVIGAIRLLQGGIEGRRGLAITAAYVHTFFDVYLKGAPPKLLNNLRHTYPEVQAVRR